MCTADVIGRIGKAVLPLDRDGKRRIAPAIQTSAEIEIIYPGGVVRGRAFQLLPQRSVDVGAAPGVDQNILTGNACIHMEQVSVTVTGTKTAAVHVNIGILVSTQHTVATIGQHSGTVQRLCRRKKGRICSLLLHAEIPEIFSTQGVDTLRAESRILKQQRTGNQQVTCIHIIRIRLQQQVSVGLEPDAQGTAHGVRLFADLSGQGAVVLLCCPQHIQNTLQHLAVVQRALLPMAAVRKD